MVVVIVLLIGPACLSLLTVVVMSPAAVAAMKHTLALHAGCVFICPRIQRQAPGLPTTANEQSISLRCIWL